MPLFSSSSTTEDSMQMDANPTAILDVEAYSGLNDEEFSVLVQTVEDAYSETVGLVGVSCDTTNTAATDTSTNKDGSNVVVGALGRVLSLRTNLEEESAECLRALIAERMDHLIYGSGELRQPVLVCIRLFLFGDRTRTSILVVVVVIIAALFLSLSLSLSLSPFFSFPV